MVTEDEREREQAGEGVVGDPSPERPTLSRRRPQLRMSVVTAVIWVLLWGSAVAGAGYFAGELLRQWAGRMDGAFLLLAMAVLLIIGTTWNVLKAARR